MSAKKKKEEQELSPETAISEPEVSTDLDTCTDCGGYGYIITPEGEAVPCNCLSGRLMTQRQAAARIPPKFLKKSLANFVARDKNRALLLEKAAEFIQNFTKQPDQHQGILMLGTVGSGKTHLAVAILKELIQKGFTGLYFNTPELLNTLRESYSEDSEQIESEIIDIATEPDLLVLDDLGAERTSGWVRDRLYLIINRRYELMKAIIVTTNLSLKELKEHVGERIVSRLFEMCPIQLEFPAEDYRQHILLQQHRRQRRDK